MKFNLKNIAGGLAKNIGLMAPVLVILAGGSVFAAQRMTADAAAAVAAKAGSKGQQLVELKQVPISQDEAYHVAQRLAIVAPTVKIVLRGSAIVISTNSSDQYAEWSHAMTAVMSLSRDVTWKPQELCAGKCSGEAVARGTVVGYRQRFSTQAQ